MNPTTPTELLDEISQMDSCFQKKFHLIRLCIDYDPMKYDLPMNLHVFHEFLRVYMVYRSNFRKKDDRILMFVQRFIAYGTSMRDQYHVNHSEYLLFLRLWMFLGILKSDNAMIRQVHLDLIHYLDDHLLNTGMLRNAMEHDSLEYHISALHRIIRLVRILQSYGYFHFDYLRYKNNNGTSLLKSFGFLLPYLKGEKRHYLYLHTIFQHDRKSPRFGSLWDPVSAKPLLLSAITLHKKIDELLSLLPS